MKGQVINEVSFSSLSTMATDVERLLRLFPESYLDWKPESWEGIPGEKFSAREQICHMRDIERDGYHKRIQAMLQGDNPSLASIDGYALVTTGNYKETDLNVAINDFRLARDKTVSMIRSIEDSQWDNTGYFEGYGTITLRALIHFLCSHDLEHLASLRWLLGKIEGERSN
jgi:hypothetical protein